MGIIGRIESTMNTHALISILLVCSVSASSSTHDVEKGHLAVLDDKGHPVKLDLNADHVETLEQTKEKIPNLVSFYLYTRSTPNVSESLYVDDVEALKKSHFNPHRPTKIVTHGWKSTYKARACVLIRGAFLQRGNCNVIVVDWSPIAKKPYLWASKRVEMVAQHLSSLLNFLVEQGVDASQVTIVGHSLGAHIAGLASLYAKERVRYIVGLDPALPGFEKAGPSSRISRGDGHYVSIIHTSGGTVGFNASIGDVDFYPNGGSIQNGCGPDISCSHSRSYYYFAEGLNSRTGFWAVKCSSYSDFEGGKCNSHSAALMVTSKPNFNVKGVYFLNTASKAPFALGY